MFTSQISAPLVIVFNVCKLPFNSIRMPSGGFIEQGGSSRPKSMCRNFVLSVAEPAKGSVEGAFGYALVNAPNRRKYEVLPIL
jgi:hypothetical protein